MLQIEAKTKSPVLLSFQHRLPQPFGPTYPDVQKLCQTAQSPCVLNRWQSLNAWRVHSNVPECSCSAVHASHPVQQGASSVCNALQPLEPLQFHRRLFVESICDQDMSDSLSTRWLFALYRCSGSGVSPHVIICKIPQICRVEAVSTQPTFHHFARHWAFGPLFRAGVVCDLVLPLPSVIFCL